MAVLGFPRITTNVPEETQQLAIHFLTYLVLEDYQFFITICHTLSSKLLHKESLIYYLTCLFTFLDGLLQLLLFLLFLFLGFLLFDVFINLETTDVGKEVNYELREYIVSPLNLLSELSECHPLNVVFVPFHPLVNLLLEDSIERVFFLYLVVVLRVVGEEAALVAARGRAQS